MLGWLCCGLCGPNRKPVGGNLKAVAWLNRNCDWEGSKRKFKDGGGRGPRGPRGTGDGWWVGGGEELGDAGEVPPSEISESSESLPPGPGLSARRVFPFPVPDCCCILKHNVKESFYLTFRIVIESPARTHFSSGVKIELIQIFHSNLLYFIVDIRSRESLFYSNFPLFHHR